MSREPTKICKIINEFLFIIRVDSFCPDFDEIYRNKEFKLKLKEAKIDLKSLEEYLEKIAILSHLINKEFIFYLAVGNNPLKVMFGGKFANFPDNLVTEIFNKINNVYQSELEKLFFDDLKRIKNTVSFGRESLRDYTEEIQKWDKFSPMYKEKKFPKNKFIVDKYTKQEEISFINELLIAQIGIIIKQKELNGKNMNLTKLHLRNYLSGYKNKQNTELYNQLMVEANAYLGLLKLPVSFKKYSKHLDEILYKRLEEVLGEDPYENYKSSIIKIYNQLKGIDPFIVKDGSESEMKESMLKKNQMNLIDINEKLIWDGKKQAKLADDDKIENKKPNDNLLTYDISQETDENVKNKLLMLRDIQQSFELERKETGENSDEDDNGLKNLMFGGGKTIDLDLIKNKSIDELKKIDLEEIGSYDIQMDENGEISNSTLYENHHEIIKLEKELNLKKSLKENTFEKISEAPENNFMVNYQKLSTALMKKDKERNQKISRALETGDYIDDPIYIQILYEEPRFAKIREKFLKKYFTQGGKQVDSAVDKIKTPLLDKYAKMPGDIVSNMMKDNTFYEYDSPEGKQTSKLYERFMDEIEEEEGNGKYEELYGPLGNSESLDEEVDDLLNIDQLIQNNLEELNKENSKKIYYDPFDKKENVNANNLKEDKRLDYEKGRIKGKKQTNKLNLL